VLTFFGKYLKYKQAKASKKNPKQMENKDLIKNFKEERKEILKKFDRKASIISVLEIFAFINFVSFMIAPTLIQITIAIVLLIAIVLTW
jgi:hypothetical protein